MLTESLLNPQAQKFIDDAVEKHGDAGVREHDHIFGDKDDIVIPVGNESRHRPIDTSKIHPSIHAALTRRGYGIHDYVGNIAVRNRKDINGNIREEKPNISTILSKDSDPEALKNFNEDKQRASRISKDHEIVISRDPQKVGRMTSSRKWCGAHCTRLPGPELKHPELASHISPEEMESGGIFHHTIEHDIKHGTLIAYLVKKGDHAAENPIGRVLLKKHHAVDAHGEIVPGRKIWKPEFAHDFGSSPDTFKATVESWANTHYPPLHEGEKAVAYKKEPELYNDGGDEHTVDVHRSKGLHRVGNTEMNINEKGLIHDKENGQPAVVTKHALASERIEHYQNGVPHRSDDKAQEVEYHYGSNGKTAMRAVWRQNGLVHRDGDKPAIVERKNVDTNDFHFHHMKYGIPHRDTKLGPAEFSKTMYKYSMNGIQHRPASEGPSSMDKYGAFTHREYGALKNPPSGGPASSSPTGTSTWAAEKDKPSIVLSSDKNHLTMEHGNGDMERYSKSTGKYTKFTDEGTISVPLSEEHHKTIDEYKAKSEIKPVFKSHID